MARTPYDNFKAISYAKQYCGQQNNSCGVYLQGTNKSDCAHFLAHCLAAGGIVVKRSTAEDPDCPHGLTARNTVLEAALKDLAAQYENVREIPLSDGIVGDIGFLQLHRPTHAFMVSRAGQFVVPILPLATPPHVWAHASSRCDDQLGTDWRQWFSSAYRLEDG